MPSTQQFRKRIRSISNTSQITKAMQMIASVKMQKAARAILSARSYTQNAWNMLTTLASLTSAEKHPLLEKREGGRTLLIIAGADRGLCGSYNSDLMRKTAKYQQDSKTAGQQDSIDVVAAGKKAADIAKKLKLNLVAEFPSFELDVEFWESRPISKLAIDGYANKTYDRVDIIYSHFTSALKQTPVVKQILPIDRNHIDLPGVWEEIQDPRLRGDDRRKSGDDRNGVEMTEYKLEPNVDAILERIVPQFIRAVVYGLFLESNASEHSARMFAMKSATDNAKDLIDDLTLTYNSIRQGNITKELAEIAGAAEAMK